LDDAGTTDTCPGCGASFDVPGVAEKEKLAAKQRAQSEYTQKQREQERAERIAQEALRQQQKQEAETQRAKEASSSVSYLVTSKRLLQVMSFQLMRLSLRSWTQLKGAGHLG
jgi:hypothetical protein